MTMTQTPSPTPTLTTDPLELFDRIRAGMDAQGWRQAGGAGVACHYKLPTDPTIGCAIGVLLPNDTSLASYGCSILHSRDFNPVLCENQYQQVTLLLEAGIDESLRDVAKLIQSTHDTAVDSIEWKARFDALDAKFRTGVYTVGNHPNIFPGGWWTAPTT